MAPRRRVFISDKEECPENAILREDQGSLFYVPGQAHDGMVGGPRGNILDGIERSDEVFKPFGPYDDMDDCISDNQEKDDPGAYCAEIHHQVTGEWPSEKQSEEFDNNLSSEASSDAYELTSTYFDNPEAEEWVEDLEGAENVIEQLDQDEVDAGAVELRSAAELLDHCIEIQLEENNGHTEETENAEQVESVLREMLGEFETKMKERVYVASEEEAPSGIEVKEDDGRLYYEKQQAYEHARALYSEDVEDELEDETDVEMPDADSAGDGTPTESEFDDELDDLRSQIHDVDDATGPVSVE